MKHEFYKTVVPPVRHSTNIGILTYEDGGKDIQEYITYLASIEDQDTYPLFINLITSLLELMEHIPTMKDSGFIHMDIKSANVVFNENNGKAKLIDFGLSKSIPYVCENATSKWYIEAQWPYETLYINKTAFDNSQQRIRVNNHEVGIYDFLLTNIKSSTDVNKFLIPVIDRQKNILIPVIQVKGIFIMDTTYYTDAIPGDDYTSKNNRIRAYRGLYPDFYLFNTLNYMLFGEPPNTDGFIRYIQSQKESFIDMMKRAASVDEGYEKFVKDVVEGVDVYCMGGVFADVLNMACSKLNKDARLDVFKKMFISLYKHILTSNIYERNVETFITDMRQIIVDSQKSLDLSQTSSSDELPLPPPPLRRSSSGGKKTRKKRKAKRRKTNRYMKKRYR